MRPSTPTPNDHRPASPLRFKRPPLRRVRILAPLVLVAVLGVSACGGVTGTDGGQATTPSGGAAGDSTTAEDPTVTSRPSSDLTAEQLIDDLQSEVSSFAQLGGGWTWRDGTPYAPKPSTAFSASSCAGSGLGYEPDDAEAGRYFSLDLIGPGAEDPETVIDAVLGWAGDRGLTEQESGEATQVQDGLRAHVTAAGRPSLEVEVGPAQSRLRAGSACSTHSSVLDHETDPSSQPSAPNRFEESAGPES